MALPTTQQQEDIASIYAAIWNRAPDPVGFGYWVDLYANGMPLDDIADAFRDSAEGVAAYPLYQTGEEFVTQVYLNVFNREPDDAGLAYWTNLLSTGVYTEGDFITVMVNSAVTQAAQGNEDGLLFINKVAVGEWVAMDYLAGNATQEQIDVVTSNAFRYVTSSASSIATAENYISHLPVGTPYELTVGQDVFNGVAGNDLFQAYLAGTNGTSNTLTLGDRLNGGDGYDTLDATLTASIAAGVFTVQNIEEVQFSAAGTDVTAVNSFAGVELIQLDNTDAYDVAVTGLASSVNASVYNVTNADLSITAGDTAASQTLYLDTVVNSTVTLTEGVAGQTPILNVIAQGGASSDIEIAGAITNATTLNVTANANVEFDALTMASLTTLTIDGSAQVDLSAATLAGGATTLITVDATDATGTVLVELANAGGASLVADFSVGNDTLNIVANTAGAGATVDVNMGAGDDTLAVLYTLPGQTTVTLDGGLGANDTLVISGVGTTGQLNDLDFTYGTVQGFETLSFDAGMAIATVAAYVTLSDGFNMVDFTDGTLSFGTDGFLSISNLENDATLGFAAVNAIAGTNAQLDLVVDSAGSLTFEFNATATIVAGDSSSNDWTLTNATDLVFDFASPTADVDVTIDFGATVAGNADMATLYADSVESIVVTGGSTASFFSLDLAGLSTASSDLTALTTVDISDFAGTVSIDLDAGNVIENDLTIYLNNGIVGAADTLNVATITASDQGDTFVFDTTLVGEVEIYQFANLNGAANSDLLDLSAFGVTGIGQLTITGSGQNWTITSSAYDGQITVHTTNSAPLTAADFIFA